MKKLLIFTAILALTAVFMSSCGGYKKGTGCPTANSSKPFRA